MKKVDFIVDYKKYSITSDDVLRVARSAQPEAIRKFYTEVAGKRCPPTQLTRLAGGAPHTYSHNSRAHLTELGFRIEVL